MWWKYLLEIALSKLQGKERSYLALATGGARTDDLGSRACVYIIIIQMTPTG